MQLRKTFKLFIVLLGAWAGSEALHGQTAYKINGKSYSFEQVYKENQGKFFELEKQKYEAIEAIAREAYLEAYWQTLASDSKPRMSPEEARDRYLKKHALVSETEIKQTLDRFKDHPRLKKLSDAERRTQVTEYLKTSKTRDVVEKIIQTAMKENKLSIVYPRPTEPIFDLKVWDTDHVKYGPLATDVKPLGCSGDDCVITVIEYSEYQCPFCVRVLPTVNRLLTEYKGKVRWIVRDFPLGFHNRAKPAAVAAKCAANQNKYWEMYDILFQNQRNLSDEDLMAYGAKIGLDKSKYEKCFNNPKKEMELIDKNYSSGEKVGVTGTPAFFINGRRLSGALPYEEFKRIFEDELSKKKKS